MPHKCHYLLRQRSFRLRDAVKEGKKATKKRQTHDNPTSEKRGKKNMTSLTKQISSTNVLMIGHKMTDDKHIIIGRPV